MYALVTGAAGQVGRYLIDRLVGRKDRLIALDRIPFPATLPGVRSVTGDIMNGPFLRSLFDKEPFDIVFHLAGVNALRPAAEIYGVNVLATATLLDVLHEHLPMHARIVLMSSSAVYGGASENPLREETTLTPLTNYGVSKMCMEMMGRVLSSETQRHVVFARPFNIVGPLQRAPLLYSSVAMQLAAIERGERAPVLELGNLENYRDYIDVRDVAAALLLIAERGEPGSAYNLCSGHAVQAREVVDYLVNLVAQPVSIRTGNRQSGPIDVPHQYGAYDKIRRLTGWAPAIPLETSLSDTLTYWRTTNVDSVG